MAQADEGAVGCGAALFSGCNEKGVAESQVPVGIRARLPALGEEMAIEMMAGESVGADDGESMSNGPDGRR